MKCTACQGKSDATIKCFLKAMDTIKEHFLSKPLITELEHIKYDTFSYSDARSVCRKGNNYWSIKQA